MLLLFAWWVLLAFALISVLAWAQYNAELMRAENTPGSDSDECQPEHTASAARLYRARTGALYAGLVFGALSTGSLVAHFLTPRMEVSLGMFGNTTL